MRQHDGFGFATDSSFDLARIDVKSQVRHRRIPVLRQIAGLIDRGGASCNANHNHPAVCVRPASGGERAKRASWQRIQN